MRDIKLVNLSLLAKWKWRHLVEEPTLSRDVLEDKYGPLVSLRSRMWERRGHRVRRVGGNTLWGWMSLVRFGGLAGSWRGRWEMGGGLYFGRMRGC